MTTSIVKNIGNLLILLSLAGFLYQFYPIMAIYFFPTSIDSVDFENYISIPHIHALAPLILDVDSQNKNLYIQALKKGVAHAKGSSYPGHPGTTFIFAHSSDYPWNISRYNTIFFRLNELTQADQILLKYQNNTYTYQVVDKKIVNSNQGEFLTNKTDQLILQTCYPPGTDFKRLLIFAKLI